MRLYINAGQPQGVAPPILHQTTHLSNPPANPTPSPKPKPPAEGVAERGELFQPPASSFQPPERGGVSYIKNGCCIFLQQPLTFITVL